MSERVKALKELFTSDKKDGYLVTNAANMHYLASFSLASRLLVPADGECVLFVHSVNYELAKKQTQGARVELIAVGEDADMNVAKEINRLRMHQVGFDTLTFSAYFKLKEWLDMAVLEDANEMISTLRKVKDESELSRIKKASDLSSKGMKKAFEILKAGMKEREVAAEIEYEMRLSGSDGTAFDTLVSSGKNSAFPHGGCGDKKIEKGDFVVVDLGSKFDGYCADITRTFFVGEPVTKQKEIYEIVKRAQEEAISCMRSGVEAKKVDCVAREHIREAGYGEYFAHSLGHGVGLDIHEFPILGPASRDVLQRSNTVTVEPGIYIPEFGGVRIEDTVVLHKDKAKKLTNAPYWL